MQAQAGDIVLLFADESEALTHPYLAQQWAPRGADLRVQTPGQAKRRALLGVREAVTGEMRVRTSASKKSSDSCGASAAYFIALLEEIDVWHGPGTSLPLVPVVLVLDNGPIHTSKATKAALASRPWLMVEWLPKYAPELNAIERDGRHLKQQYLANRIFVDGEDLECCIHESVADINRQRVHKTCTQLPILA